LQIKTAFPEEKLIEHDLDLSKKPLLTS